MLHAVLLVSYLKIERRIEVAMYQLCFCCLLRMRVSLAEMLSLHHCCHERKYFMGEGLKLLRKNKPKPCYTYFKFQLNINYDVQLYVSK